MTYSMNEIGRHSSVSVSYISLIANNKRKASMETAKELERVSGIPVQYWTNPDKYQKEFRKLFSNKQFGK